MLPVLNMVAKTQPYDDYIRENASKTKRIQCARCNGLLFFAIHSFRNTKHGINIKCKKCGYKNNL